MHTSPPVIAVTGLTKDFFAGGLFARKPFRALDAVSLTVEKGLIFGLLGQNGAGKTTLIKSLLGLLHPTSGTYLVFGREPEYALRKRVGYLPENPRFPVFLRARDAMKVLGKLSGLGGAELENAIDRSLDLVKMRHAEKGVIRTFSKGMQQRLALAQAIMHDPELVILDEPTDGVDPVGRKEIRDILLNLKAEGKTVFLNSHILSEVELITDRVAMLNKGRLIAEGNVRDLTTSKLHYEIHTETPLAEHGELIRGYIPSARLLSDRRLECVVADTVELNSMIDKLRGMNVLITSVQPNKSSLEDVYVRIVKEDEQ